MNLRGASGQRGSTVLIVIVMLAVMLALVMAGAIAVALPAFAWAKRRKTSMLGTPLSLPTSTTIDARLVGGGLLFGVGWGLAGFCPGPALVALGMGEAKALLFVVAMLAGMGGFELIERRHTAPAARGA